MLSHSQSNNKMKKNSDIYYLYFFSQTWWKFQLNFSDRSTLLSQKDGDIFDPAPPVFTPQTRNGPRIYRKSFSEPFQVKFCC